MFVCGYNVLKKYKNLDSKAFVHIATGTFDLQGILPQNTKENNTKTMYQIVCYILQNINLDIDSNGKIQKILALLALLALIALLVGVSSVGKYLPIRIERLNCSLAYRRFLITINYCFYCDFPFN